jgi:hypothetical protein
MAADSPVTLPATRRSWTNHPLPEKRSRLMLRREFTGQEYEALRRGLIPEAMEDKWFIFMEGDTLCFHRSWTGFCIYQLRLRKEGEGYAVDEALVNRDPGQYAGGGEAYDVKLLTFLIDVLLLGKVSTFPVPAGVPAGMATGLYHQHVAGVGSRVREKRERAGATGWVWAWLKWLLRGLAREWKKR